MNKEFIKWLLFICVFFCICFFANIKFSSAIIGFFACLLGGWAYGKHQDIIAKKVADELEKRQQEKE